jgi:hypothetical protein
MGLIVKAGLDALGMKPRRVRHGTLGRFPEVQLLAVINEEEEVADVSNVSREATNSNEDVDDSDWDDLESNHSSESNDSQPESNQEEEDLEEQDEPINYRKRKEAYLLGDTYMKQLTKDVCGFVSIS